MTISRPQGTSLPEHGRNHQHIVKPRNPSATTTHQSQDANPRLNENLGIIGMEYDTGDVGGSASDRDRHLDRVHRQFRVRMI
jgi:hypothetical protein